MRAFVVGNGPSLDAFQLGMIHKNKEVSFGVNRIHLIYPQTVWRPTYWVIMDFSNSLFYREDIALHSALGYECHVRNDILAKYLEWCIKHKNLPFMDNLRILERCNHIDSERRTSEGWHEPLCQMGGSVPAAIQMAVEMGHNPIYLIGCDGGPDHFDPKYDEHDTGGRSAEEFDEMLNKAFQISFAECWKRDIKIYNATPNSKIKGIPKGVLQ